MKRVERQKQLIKLEEKMRKQKTQCLKLRKQIQKFYTAELVCTKTDGKTKYEFSLFTSPLKFARKNHNYEITLDEAIYDQEKLENSIIRRETKESKPRKAKKKKKRIEQKNKVLESAKKLLYVRNDIINAFYQKVFPYKDSESKTKEEKFGENSEEELKEYINSTFTFIEEKSKEMNNDLFTKYFNFSTPIDLANQLYETKNKNKNSEFLKEIKNRWSNLKDEVEKMSKEKIENKKPNEILETVNEIIDFNKEIQKQRSSILTPDQMLSKLSITLAQLNAGNNSEKLKNELQTIIIFCTDQKTYKKYL